MLTSGTAIPRGKRNKPMTKGNPADDGIANDLQ
jgi:hypothetical protein